MSYGFHVFVCQPEFLGMNLAVCISKSNLGILIESAETRAYNEKKFMNLSDSVAQRFKNSGVAKVYKNYIPLRSIPAMINAPQHELAKWLTEVVKSVLKIYSTHLLKDTFEL